MWRLPSKVLVGAYVFKVVRRPATGDLAGRDGLCDPSKLTISIASGLSPARVRVIFLHELFHAIWWVYSIPARVVEERAVTTLAEGLTAVLVANPGLSL